MWKKQGSVVLRLEQSRVPGCLYLPQLLSHLIVPFLPCSKCSDLMIYMQVDYVCSHAAIDTVGQHQSSKATVHTLHYRRRWIAGLIQILRYYIDIAPVWLEPAAAGCVMEWGNVWRFQRAQLHWFVMICGYHMLSWRFILSLWDQSVGEKPLQSNQFWLSGSVCS